MKLRFGRLDHDDVISIARSFLGMGKGFYFVRLFYSINGSFCHISII